MRRHVIAAILVVAAVLVLEQAGLLAGLALSFSDWRFAVFDRQPSGQVAVVEIDSKSLAAIGRWPWPRRTYAEAIDRLVDGGASLIALDVDFSSPSDPPEDAALEAAIARAGGAVVLPVFRQRLHGTASAQTTTFPQERFTRNAWTALADVEPDEDGRVRRITEAATIDGQTILSMPFMLAGRQADVDVRDRLDFSIDIGRIERFSFADLVAGKVAPERLKGRTIIVGATAIELHDYLSVPRHGVVSGPVFLALATETVLLDRILAPAPYSALLAFLAAFLGLGLFLRWRRGMLACLVLMAAGILGVEATALAAQHWARLAIDTLGFDLAVLAFCVLQIAFEIGEKRRLLQRTRLEKERLRRILSQVISDNLEGIIVADASARVIFASHSASALLGLGQAIANRQALSEIIPGAFLAALTTGGPIGDHAAGMLSEITIEPQDGAGRTLEYVVTRTELDEPAASGKPDFMICIMFRDITERKAASRQIETLAMSDSLTGLDNRRSFFAGLRRQLARRGEPGGAVALLLLDLRRLKSVNDTFGHGAGDAILREMAERLRSCLGPSDDAARLDGDEFAVIARDIASLADAEALARRIADALARPFAIDGYPLPCGVSIGIAEARDGEEEEGLLARADAALRSAKTSGRDMIQVYDRELEASLDQSRALEEDLRHALPRGELWIAYQPQVNLATREIVGVEALVRWSHPRLGQVSPAHFVPVAERIGLICAIGEFALEQACRDAGRWPDHVKISVNVSPGQFVLKDLPERFDAILAKAGLAPERLIVEITESLFIGDFDHAAATLEALRRRGIEIAMDDFGTGYSSLGYLQRLAIDKIKIDQSFVRNVPQSASSTGIIRSIAMLAQTLGIEVIAEGIEDEAQVACLHLIGCSQGQGYLFSRAVPASAIDCLVERPQAPPSIVELMAAGAWNPPLPL